MAQTNPRYPELVARIEGLRTALAQATSSSGTAIQELQYAEQENRRYRFIFVMRGLLPDGLDVVASGLGSRGGISGVELEGVDLAGFAEGDLVTITRDRLLIAVVRVSKSGRGEWTDATFGFPRSSDAAQKVVDQAALTRSISLRFEQEAIDGKNDATLRMLVALKERQ
jgi:hypothetical protein